MKTLFISLLILITTQLSWALVNVQAGFITENDAYKSGYGATLEIDPIPFVSVGTGLFSREGKENGSILTANSFVFNPGQTIQVPVYIKLNSPELPLTGLSVHASAGYLFTNSSPSTTTILNLSLIHI